MHVEAFKPFKKAVLSMKWTTILVTGLLTDWLTDSME
jgi:hypothetical protein